MIPASLVEQVKRHEGLRLKPYICPAGKLTIGYGRNLDDNGITEKEAEELLINDLLRAEDELFKSHPWVESLPTKVQDALINMVFNLGISRFNRFRKMLAALKNNDFDTAAKEALNSKWATQVGKRAHEIANQIRQG